MTNIVKARRLSPISKDKFHWTSVDKEGFDNGLLKKTENSNLENLCCVGLRFLI